MKRTLLFLLCAFLTMVSVQKVQAYTLTDLTDAGWTQATSSLPTPLSDYYFVLVDGTLNDHILTRGAVNATTYRPGYKTLADPTQAVEEVWIIEASNDKYRLKSYADNYYYTNGSAGWNNNMVASADVNSDLTFTLNGGIYHLSTTAGYVGAYVTFNFEECCSAVAGNNGSGGDKDHGFRIYYKSRTNFTPANKPSITYTAAGWMRIDALTDWGNSTRQYVFLDVSELTGYETGMVVTAQESNLPQYQYSDMSDNKQKWYTEASGVGYALKNVEYNTYSNYTAPWGGNMSADKPSNVFVPTYVSEGKWYLKNTVDNSNWLGRWGNGDNGRITAWDPAPGERLAANKQGNNTNGRRYYLIYAIPTSVGTAEALPNSGDMTAGKWYFFDVNLAGEYNAKATKLDDITCVEYSTGENKKLTATNNSLAVTRYYVKSTSDNNLAIYYVGEATVDKSYVQPGNTVTVAWADATTNDPGATFGKNGTPTITFGGDAVDITPTATGFTFIVPAGLSANTKYTLSIPAEAFGYAEGATYNAAQNITLTTPVLFDGTYFFRVENTYDVNGEYLTKNNGDFTGLYGEGWAIAVATDAQNKTTLMYDGKYFRMSTGNNWDCYTNSATNDAYSKFNLVASDTPGEFYITTYYNKYFKFNIGDIHQDGGGRTRVWADANDVSGSGYEAVKFKATVTTTITAAGWATYCSPYALDFSSDINNLTAAYIITGVADNKLTLVKVTGTVPANTGLLLKGEGACAIPVAASSSTDVSSNKLVGVTSSTLLDAKAGYVLMGSPSVGFYKNANNFTLGANTAYLPAGIIAEARPVLYLDEDDAPTAISFAEQWGGAERTQLKDGKYFVGNRIILVKNGVKFSVNGQILK